MRERAPRVSPITIAFDDPDRRFGPVDSPNRAAVLGNLDRLPTQLQSVRRDGSLLKDPHSSLVESLGGVQQEYDGAPERQIGLLVATEAAPAPSAKRRFDFLVRRLAIMHELSLLLIRFPAD